MRLYAVLLLVLMVIVALDSGRFRWSVVPPWAQSIGWVLLVICGAVVWHVSIRNAYLSRYARIQDDRGQVVVRDGLYGPCATRCTSASSCCSVGCRSCSARGARTFQGLSGFPNPETLNMTRSCADEGLTGQPRLEEYGPCIARRRRGVVSDQARLRTGVDP